MEMKPHHSLLRPGLERVLSSPTPEKVDGEAPYKGVLTEGHAVKVQVAEKGRDGMA